MAENITNFRLKKEQCTGCGKCVKVCPGGILHINGNKKVEIEAVQVFGWDGCWKCQRCMAVCPRAAISIFDKQPKDCLAVRFRMLILLVHGLSYYVLQGGWGPL